MIDLSLKRILKLVPTSASFPWRAIHVAGTNGKGSVCAYISSCLQAAQIPNGRFNSPHLVDRWDCITINGATVESKLFHQVENIIKNRDADMDIEATEFELLTATAFEIFTRERVEIGVVEVGMGGRLDATNIIENPLATVITKIGLDHQNLLGSTLEEIAKEKAGILKKGVPCIIDGSNTEPVLSAVREIASNTNAGDVILALPLAVDVDCCEVTTPSFGYQKFTTFLPGGYQPANLSCAVNVLACLTETYPSITPGMVEEGIANTKWPGRLQELDLTPITGDNTVALVDGAHNVQAAQELSAYVDLKLRRKKCGRVCWLMAASKGKNIEDILRVLVQKGDSVIGTAFPPVDGMPWVEPEDPKEIMKNAQKYVGEGTESQVAVELDMVNAIKQASKLAGNGKVVICGSLYLVGNVLRLAQIGCNAVS